MFSQSLFANFVLHWHNVFRKHVHHTNIENTNIHCATCTYYSRWPSIRSPSRGTINILIYHLLLPTKRGIKVSPYLRYHMRVQIKQGC